MALGLDHDHLADDAVVDLRHGFGEQSLRTQLLAGGEDPLRGARRFHYRLNLCRRNTHRLFAVDVLAAFQRCDGHLGMEVRGGRNVHGVDIRAVDDLAPIRIGLGVVASRRGCRLIETVGLEVAKRDYLRAGLFQNPLQQIRPAIAGPDQRGPDLGGRLA